MFHALSQLNKNIIASSEGGTVGSTATCGSSYSIRVTDEWDGFFNGALRSEKSDAALWKVKHSVVLAPEGGA